MTKKVNLYYKYLELMFNSTEINCVICRSKAGYGKTHSTLEYLKQQKKEFVYNSGVTTAVALYIMLCENKNKIIVLDDVENIFSDDRAVNLLKAALWGFDNKRMITYKTSSKVLQDYPDEFEFTGKLIILANNIHKYNKNCESFKALISRCIDYELILTQQELMQKSQAILRESTLTQQQQTLTNNILQKHINHDYNLRLLKRLMIFIQTDPDNAEQLYCNSIEQAETSELNIIHKIVTHTNNVKEQAALYKNYTGKGRATYYRKKKEYLKLQREGYI